MSGLLRRLARHAQSASRPTIHAMARLPYMPAPALLPVDDADVRAPTMAPTAAPAMSPPPASAEPAPAAPAPQSMPTPQPATVRNPIHRAAIDDRGAEARLASPVSQADRLPPALMPAAPTDRPADPATSPVVPDAEHATERAGAAAPTPLYGHPQATPQPQPPPATRPAIHDARALPDALLPPSPPPARATTAAVGAHPPAPAADTPTEVHVHIGRIEVTAVHAPAAPRPAARSGRAPMSLDEYLARRQGSGS